MTADSGKARGLCRLASPQLAWGLWLAAITAVLVRICLTPGSRSVYRNFHAGGARWLAGANLYPKVGEFLYSPFAAAFFAPFAILPDGPAEVFWRLINVAAFAGGFAAWLRSTPAVPIRSAVYAWLLLLPLSVGNFFNGQANPLMIGLLMFAVLACRHERWLLAAFCVALPAFFKVYPLSVGLLLAVLHPRKFPLRLAFALVSLFVLSLLLQKPIYALDQYVNWIHSLRMDPRRTLNYYGTDRDFWLLLRLLHVPITQQAWAILQALAGATLAAWLWIAQRRGQPPDRLDFLLLTLGACWMLLFGPETESATYVILAPPLLLAWLRWRGEPSAHNYVKTAVAVYLLLIASQMLSSWRHQSQNAYTHAIQPIAALILATAAISYGSEASKSDSSRAGHSD